MNLDNKVINIRDYISYNSTKGHMNVDKIRILKAMENKEIVPYIQPKYDIKNSKIVGVEALARWIGPNGEIINPCDFINIIEENGLTIEFDLYMIKEVCSILEKWSNNKLKNIPISVNVSRKSLELGELFINKIDNILHNINFDIKMIELEITEDIIIYDYEKLIKTINCLMKYGFKIVIDDFGTGGSCLNMLKSVYFDTVKLDKGFLDRGKASMNSKIIIKNIAKMIKELGAEMVVEGIETKEYISFLNSIDCNIIQGYLISKPLSVYEFENIKEFNI